MNFYLLQLEATLINCTNLQLQNGFDHPSHQYHFQLFCMSCKKMVQARVTYAIRVPFPPELLEDDSDSSVDEVEEDEIEKLRFKEYINKIRKKHPDVHFTHSCECDNSILVNMRLGYGSPLEIAGEATAPQSSLTAMMGFYVYGAIPINYQMGGGWQVDMVGGNRRFEGVDLSEAHVDLQEGEEDIERPVLILRPKASFVLSNHLDDYDNDGDDN